MGPAKRGARSAYKRFGGAKTLPEAEFISAEDEKNWGPHPILIGWGAPAPESIWSAARADVSPAALAETQSEFESVKGEQNIMTISEKVAYLKGMFDGMALDTEKSKEAKLIGSMLEVLEEIGLTLEDIDDSFDAVGEEIDALSDDLSDVEEAVFGEDDEDDDCCCDDVDEDFFEIECPNCGEPLCIDEDVLEAGTIQCPSCEQKFVLDLSDECDDDACGCGCGCEEHDHEDEE